MDEQTWQRGELHAQGATEAAIRWFMGGIASRAGYAGGDAPPDAVVDHIAQIRAATGRLCGASVFSHGSAALLHGLPVWGVPLDRVQVSRNRSRSGGRRGTRVHIHAAPMAPDEITVVDGLAVTSIERTLIDVGRTLPFEPAVVIADAALARRLTTRAAVATALTRRPRVIGLPAARRVIAFADGRGGSVGGSRSRVALARAGLPPPALLHLAKDGDDEAADRFEFGWPDLGVVGEFDGLTGCGGPPHDAPSTEVVYPEWPGAGSRNAEGAAVVRWTWADLDDFAPVAARIRAAFSTGRPTAAGGHDGRTRVRAS